MVQIPDPRAFLRATFDAAIAAAQPALSLPPHLPAAPKGRLIGAGRASAAMARAIKDAQPARRGSSLVGQAAQHAVHRVWRDRTDNTSSNK